MIHPQPSNKVRLHIQKEYRVLINKERESEQLVISFRKKMYEI